MAAAKRWEGESRVGRRTSWSQQKNRRSLFSPDPPKGGVRADFNSRHQLPFAEGQVVVQRSPAKRLLLD